MIIAVLFTALFGPYFVNWTTYKQTFETEASRLLGENVRVGGRADLRLLPSPKVAFTDVRIGNDDEHPTIVIERVVAELELSPLLRGEVRVLNMAVERPTVSVDLSELFGPDALTWKRASFDPDDVSLANVEIRDGQATITDDRTGRQWEITTINGLVDARSLSGPAQIEWGAFLGDRPVSGRLAIGRSETEASIPVTVTFEPPHWPAVLVADGRLKRDENGTPFLEGKLEVTGNSAGAEYEEDEEFDLASSILAQGGFTLTQDVLTVPEFQVSLGPAERPIQFVGEADFRLDEEPRFDVAISARQIDLDRSLGGGPDRPIGLSPAFDATLARLKALPAPAIDGEIRIDATGIVVGGNVIRAVGADLSPAENGWQIKILSAMMPGATRLDVSGDVSLLDDTTFKGQAKVQSQRPASFATWWRPDRPVPQGLEPFSLAANLSISETETQIDDLEATFGGGTTSGDIRFRNFADRNERFMGLDLASDRLDIDQARAVIELIAGDISKPGAIDRLSFDLDADMVIANNVIANNVIAAGAVEPEGLQIQKLSIADLAGAQISARGTIKNPLTDPSGRLDGSVLADDLTGTAKFISDLFPDSTLTNKFVEVAPYLAPASADLAVIVEETGIASSVELTGQFAKTTVSLTASGAGDLKDIETLSVDLNGLLVSQDTAEVLSQIGIDVIPLPDAGPTRLSIDLTGSFDEFASLTVDGEIAGISMQLDGGLGGDIGEGQFAADLSIDSPSVDTALLLAGIAMPGVGEGHSLTSDGKLTVNWPTMVYQIGNARFNEQLVNGDIEINLGSVPAIKGALDFSELSLPLLASVVTGYLPEKSGPAWSNSTFAPAISGPIEVDLDLAADQADLGLRHQANNVQLRYSLDGSRLSMDDMVADFAGGRLIGSLSAEHRNGVVTLDSNVALTGAALQELVWTMGPRAAATGKLDLSFALAGEGRTMSGLVSSLSGSGTIVIEDGVIRAINPRAFSSIVTAADSGMELDTDTVERVFTGFLDKGTLGFGRATGSFAVSGGVARFSTMSIDTPSATVLGSATLDFNRHQLNSDWSLKVDAGDEAVTGAEPEVGLLFSGPLTAPSRRLDVSPLLGYLTVRAFEKEVDRIEKLQSEILEEERLRRELRLIRERAQRREREAEAAQQAAEDAQAEAERAAALEEEEAQQRQARQEREQAEAAAEAARRAEEEAAARQAEQERKQAEAAAEAAERAEREEKARLAEQERQQPEAAASAVAQEPQDAPSNDISGQTQLEVIPDPGGQSPTSTVENIDNQAPEEGTASTLPVKRPPTSVDETQTSEKPAVDGDVVGREARARQQAEQRAQQEAAARREAEERAEREAAARRAAEERAAKEAAARQDAEDRIRREIEARIEAERRAEAEAAARRAAEDRAALAAAAAGRPEDQQIIIEPTPVPEGAQPTADGFFRLPSDNGRVPTADQVIGVQPIDPGRRATGAPLTILPPRIIEDLPIFTEPPRIQPLR